MYEECHVSVQKFLLYDTCKHCLFLIYALGFKLLWLIYTGPYDFRFQWIPHGGTVVGHSFSVRIVTCVIVSSLITILEIKT